MMDNQSSGSVKTKLLIQELQKKREDINKESGYENPLKMLKQQKESIDNSINEIKESIKDANRVQLIKVSDIVPLISNGKVMHNRSAMATKDKEEISKFAESIKLAQKDKAGLFGLGLINAITVRVSNTENSKYELISGYRRTRAFELLGLPQIPAFVIECNDKVARRLRNAENKQRRDVNAYDETYGELEEIQLYCDFNTLDETEKALRKAKRIIDIETKILKDIDRSSPNFVYTDLIKKKSNYTLVEHEKANFLKDVVLEMSQRQLNTFVNRLEILDISDEIKKHMYDNSISYTEALSLKKILKDNNEIIDSSVEYLIESEKNGKRLSSKEFEIYLKNRVGYKDTNRGHKESIFNTLKSNLALIEKQKLELSSNPEMKDINKKIEEINEIILNFLANSSK